MYSLFYLLYAVPLLVIGLIIYLIVRAVRRRGRGEEKDWSSQRFLSKEDFVSQVFFVLSVVFLGITLSAFNGDLGNLLPSLTILLITVVSAIFAGYYFKSIYTVFGGLVGLGAWWVAQGMQWVSKSEQPLSGSAIFVGLVLLAITYYLIGRIHEKDYRFARLAKIYSFLGLSTVTVILFFISTKSGLRFLAELTEGNDFFASWKISLSLLVFFSALVVSLCYAFFKKLILKSEGLVAGFLAIIFIVLLFLPAQQLFLEKCNQFGCYNTSELSASGVPYAIFLNILIFLYSVGVIFLGYLRRKDSIINFGVLLVFVLIITKYVDWFFSFLDKSIFFIGAGILLFIIGWFMERSRRYLLSNIKEKA